MTLQGPNPDQISVPGGKFADLIREPCVLYLRMEFRGRGSEVEDRFPRSILVTESEIGSPGMQEEQV